MQLRSPARAPTINLTWSLATAVAAHADVASSSKPHAHMTCHSLPGGYVGAGLMSWLFHFIPCPLTPPPSRPQWFGVHRPSAHANAGPSLRCNEKEKLSRTPVWR